MLSPLERPHRPDSAGARVIVSASAGSTFRWGDGWVTLLSVGLLTLEVADLDHVVAGLVGVKAPGLVQPEGKIAKVDNFASNSLNKSHMMSLPMPESRRDDISHAASTTMSPNSASSC